MTRPTTRGPLDLYLVYLTPSAHGVGQRLAVRTIERQLATLPLRPTLRLLAILAHRADVSVRDHSERLVLAQVLLRPGPWRDRAVALVQGGQGAVVSSQVALQLAQRALVHCPDIPATIGDGELGFRIGTLILALADHMSSGSRNDDELLLELVRLSLFYRLHGLGDWYTTAHGVFFETIPSMTDDHEYVDVDALLQVELGLSLEHFWAIGATVGIIALGDAQLHEYPKQIGNLPSEILSRWFATQTQTIDEARSRAQQDLGAGSPWALDTFFLRPIINGIGEEGGFPMRSQLLALKPTLIGMHYLVFDLLRQAGGNRHLAWSRFLGRAVEVHGRQLLETLLSNPGTLSCPEAEQAAGPTVPPACDFYIDEASAVIAGDFVHRALTLPTQTTGSPKALEKDLRYAIVEKVKQTDSTLTLKAPSAERIYPVIVMSGPLPMNPILTSKLKRLLAEEALQVIGVDPRCERVSVLELHELRMLLLMAATNNIPVSDILSAWVNSPLGGDSFRNWMVTQFGLAPGRALAGETWEKVVGTIFGDEGAIADALGDDDETTSVESES